MVYVHLAKGFEELEAITILDVLRRGDIEAKFVSIEDKLVEGAHGIKVEADLLQEEADYSICDMIVLPGGLEGTENLLKNQTLRREIKSFVDMGRWVAAICAAPLVFGDVGILESKKATIYPGMEEHLCGGSPRREKVVVDDRIITSQGPATAMAFALQLVDAVKGRTKRGEVAREMLYEERIIW